MGQTALALSPLSISASRITRSSDLVTNIRLPSLPVIVGATRSVL